MTHKVIDNATLRQRRERAVPRGPFHVAPIFVTRAEGSRLWDADGNQYIDFCGGIGALNVGHNHPKVVRAVRDQIDRFMHTSWHVGMYDSYLTLAERLNALAPVANAAGSATPSTMTCFFNSGAEAVENAVKVARYVTRRDGVVAFERSFHGRTLMAMSLTGKVHPYTAGFGPFAPEVYRLPYKPFFGRNKGVAPSDVAAACRESLERLFSYHTDKSSIACILLEPVLGEGGFLPLHPEAVRVIKEVCHEAGILLIADEVQTGFGRCGYLFASEHFDLQPDIMVFAKSVGGGMPLSGISARSEILDAPHVGGIGGTFGGNPVACAAGNAVLDIMKEEDLPARARTIGTRVMSVFESLVAAGGAAGDARGLGAMRGLEIVDPKTKAPDAERAKTIVARCHAEGLLIMTASGTVLRTLMPLNIPEEDLERGLSILERAVRSAA